MTASLRAFFLSVLFALTDASYADRSSAESACFERNYSPGHLASHPEQTVTSITVLLNTNPQYFRLSVLLRGQKKSLATGGECKLTDVQSKLQLSCDVECDGGGVGIIRNSKGITVNLVEPSGRGSIRLNSNCDGEAPGFELEAGLDDKVFRLDTAPLSKCSYLATNWDKPFQTSDATRVDHLSALPVAIRNHVLMVRNKCRSEIGDFTLVDTMQGIKPVALGVGRNRAFLVDDEELCSDAIAGANCSNRGCDLAIWLENQPGDWIKSFDEHLHQKIISINNEGQLVSMTVSIFAGDPKCGLGPPENYTSGQTCDARVSYQNGEWVWDVLK